MRLIDADALKAIFDDNPFEISCQEVENIIDEQPTIDPSENGGCWGCCCERLGEVKRGKWEKIFDRNYKCSSCGAWWYVETYDELRDLAFCPTCGAQMERNRNIKKKG